MQEKLRTTEAIKTDEISIVIPVKDNQVGIESFLRTFFETQQPVNYPKEILIVDNNSQPPIELPNRYHGKGVHIKILTCSRIGPAAARNEGSKYAKGKWLLFVDSDCIPTENMIEGYQCAEPGAVAYQGQISSLGNDYLSNYYISQQIHLPPTEENGSPKYLITANALVQKEAFDLISGFNEVFNFAGGEDIDLALRLHEIGKLKFASQSIVLHDFHDGLSGFIKRFVRYGRGVGLVKKYHYRYKFPMPFTAKVKSVAINHFLAIIQWCSLFIGYTILLIKNDK